MLRVTNPLGSSLSFITIFGQQLLALTDDGSRMLCWDTETAGGHDLFLCLLLSTGYQSWSQQSSLTQSLRLHIFFIRPHTSTKFSYPVSKATCNYGTSAQSQFSSLIAGQFYTKFQKLHTQIFIIKYDYMEWPRCYNCSHSVSSH